MFVENEGEEIEDEVSLELILVLVVALALFIFMFKQSIRCLRQLNLYVAGRGSSTQHHVPTNDVSLSVLESTCLDGGSELYEQSKWGPYSISSSSGGSCRELEKFDLDLYDQTIRLTREEVREAWAEFLDNMSAEEWHNFDNYLED